MKIDIIPVLNDNYSYFLSSNGVNAVIDPGEAEPIIAFMEKNGIKALHTILCTHHHGDHIGGNAELLNKYGCEIVGPKKDENRIPNMNLGLKEDDIFNLNGYEARVFETPGHTSNHIIFYFEKANAVFTGDTLFSMGCGRLFEGNAEQMWNSMQKILSLPDNTMIYCGHEYTLSNAEFCLGIEPENEDLKSRLQEVKKLQAENKPTLPVSLEMEKKTNAFIRAGSAKEFAKIRQMKDAA